MPYAGPISRRFDLRPTEVRRVRPFGRIEFRSQPEQGQAIALSKI